MKELAYQGLYRGVASEIDKTLAAALDKLPVHTSPSTKEAVTELLAERELAYPLCVLPMIAYAAETGTPRPAAPLSAIHVLWWTSACYLDDLADGHHPIKTGSLSGNEALLAATAAGHSLPLQVIQDLDISPSEHKALITEFISGWTIGIEGQLCDIRESAETASRASAIATYRGKSGAPYGMITAMASILSGAISTRTALWREFGYTFGILWQMFNDQQDILSGRHEDLRNRTVTYLLACAVEDAPPSVRQRLVNLSSAAQHSEASRQELTGLLVEPPLLQRYQREMAAFRDEAHLLLDTLGGSETYLVMLRELVDDSAQLRL
ncbi:Polyprenyl synthetase (plasmid) [Streptomyces sp. YIM 121038]|uniref:polyprenyl synthetase family protein n=1 Tax=Streptomyces sp. YIM 121038 TaxID=2136401 RepID=UPI00110FFD46|nr:polyprenyl synthetase family protein [Streptomyces sp. YIM 121038]QCX82642.1 Polyprenyl synthetase [Streptomyces sp. YIM 121038]